MKENPKENYPYAYDEGWRKSEELYSRGFDRQHGFNYAEKACRYLEIGEIDAYLEGFMMGWEDEETHDYKTQTDLILEEDGN